MNRFILDILTSSMLDASLVAAQALVLNRLGVPFAAITSFSGIGAYAIALALSGSGTLPVFALLITVLIVLVFSLFARLLPQDQYLLLTLAVLGVMRATAGSVQGLGGQLGLSAASTILPPQSSLPFMVAALLLFVASLSLHGLINRSEFGLAINVARISRTDPAARAFAPVRSVTLVSFFLAAAVASSVGVLKALYSGRVDPDQFRIRNAVVLLMATLVAGSAPLRIGLLGLFFFAFPDLFGYLFGYNASSLAFIREIVWAILIMVMVSGNLGLRSRLKAVASRLSLRHS